jgi:hypothetical protein
MLSEEERLRKRKQAVLFADINASLRSYYGHLKREFGAAQQADKLFPRSEAATAPSRDRARPTGAR